MIRQLTDLPDGVLGFEATGQIREEDYRDTLVPAVQAQITAGHDVRIVLVFPEFAGYTAGAAWEDLKLGLGKFLHWKRIALVTDVGWMAQMAGLFGWVVPGDVKRFALADRDEAIAWAAGSSTSPR